MTASPAGNDEQAVAWNGPSGQAWIELQTLLDQMFKAAEDLLVKVVSAASSSRVLDVGCGTGSTTLAVARLLGTRGNCIGVDISDPMIAVARERAEQEPVPATFICADAQVHEFEPASIDMIISRFGAMFFNDPIAAFANLHRAASDDAEMRVIAWRSAAENPFMTTAERAAAPLLPNLPARQPNAPGQFAFADAHRVSLILQESGWAGIDLQPIDIPCSFPEKDLVSYLMRLGPVGQLLQKSDDQTRTRVIEAVRTAFDPYIRGSEVHFTAACWMIAACANDDGRKLSAR